MGRHGQAHTDAGGPLQGRALAAVAVATLMVGPALIGVIGTGASATGPQVPGSPIAPTAAEVSPICTTTEPASALGPTSTTLPTTPITKVFTPPGSVVGFTATASNLYVDDGTHLITTTLTGATVSSFALPAGFTGNSASQPVVDPSGNIYLSSYYGQKVDKFSPTGSLLWSVDPRGGNPTHIFSVGTGSSFRLMATLVQNTTSSVVLDTSTGAVTGTFPLVDQGWVTQTASGNLLVSANGYVETVSPSGSVLATFGAPNIEGNGVHTGSGTQFYYPGQAVQGPDGTIFTADPLTTIEATSPQGFLQGSTTLGDTLAFGGWGLSLVGGTLYFQSGPPFNAGKNVISAVPLSTVQAFLAADHVPANSLGWGAGLTTPVVGNYFGPGQTPSVSAKFDPWWTARSSHLTLSYSVENRATLDAEVVPTPTSIPLPTTAAGLASLPLTLPASDLGPGPYLVQATLKDSSTSPPTVLGTTCMPYTVGATGDRLNFATLPVGEGSGGPADPRGIALDAQLGLTGHRSLTLMDWHTVLPSCSATAPTAAACGPSAMNFTGTSLDPFRAAALAKTDHVAYWMQISGGDDVSKALVKGGWWQADIAAIVAHYATVPAGCSPCAPVTGWEPWNESNNTGWVDGKAYVTQVLAPFYAAVKSVEPGTTSTVLGGSSLEPSVWWWKQVAAAGGLADMDVAAIHPYTGNNNSFEESGLPAQIQQLRTLLGSKPLWFSEVGWWSDGDYNYLSQADSVARAQLWQRVLGIPVWSYFFDEGSFGNNGVSFSLIQAKNGVDYVKPAALASMTTTGLLAGRSQLGMPATGIPHTFRADFGAASGGTTALSALWSDGLAAPAAVMITAPGGGSIPVTVTDEFGVATKVTVTSGTTTRLPIGDHVTYLTYPVGDTVAVGPTEAYGADVAATAAGGVATASSGNGSAAIAGLPSGADGWTSQTGDTTPSLTVNFANTTTVDRVIVDTQSVGSIAAGLRNYTVSLNEPGSGWVTVATKVGQYRNHQAQFAVAPVAATGVRIDVSTVNFGGYYGGGVPPWWPATQVNPVTIHAVEVFAGNGGPAVVAGADLIDLVPSASGTGTTTTTGATGGTSTTSSTMGTTSTTTTHPATTSTTVAPTTTSTGGPASSTTTVPAGSTPMGSNRVDGYRVVASGAQVASFGDAPYFGPVGSYALNRPIVGMAATPGGGGYWLVGADGGIFAFGDARFLGSTGGIGLNRPIVGMAAASNGNGYWLVGADGGVFAVGSAPFKGSTGGLDLNQPIVGMAATPDGGGYWLVAADGGIFAFGDAAFHGSTGGLRLREPIVGMAATEDGGGYWLVARDGGVFAFGDAAFHGSAGGFSLRAPIVGMTVSPGGNGYWLAAADGGVFAFGDATFHGSAATGVRSGAIVGIS